VHQPLINSFNLKGGSLARNQIPEPPMPRYQTTSLSPSLLLTTDTHSKAHSNGQPHPTPARLVPPHGTRPPVRLGRRGIPSSVDGRPCVEGLRGGLGARRRTVVRPFSTVIILDTRTRLPLAPHVLPPVLTLARFARRILLELLNQIGGHKREFSLTDITIQRPFKSEHVPPVLLFVISLAVPLVFLVGVGAGVYQSRWDVHNGVLGEFLGFGVWPKRCGSEGACVRGVK
jgi:hypothetical protein